MKSAIPTWSKRQCFKRRTARITQPSLGKYRIALPLRALLDPREWMPHVRAEKTVDQQRQHFKHSLGVHALSWLWLWLRMWFVVVGWLIGSLVVWWFGCSVGGRWWLLVVGCWLLVVVVGCWLLVVGCWSFVGGRCQSVVQLLLPAPCPPATP